MEHTEKNCQDIAKILSEELTNEQLLAYIRNLKRVSFFHSLKSDAYFFDSQVKRLHLDDDTVSRTNDE